MELTSPKVIKELLSKYRTKSSRGLGQNFLIHSLTLKKVIETAELNSNDTILEIGPGLGTLTQELARVAKKVIAIEKDWAMVKMLQETLKGNKNVEVIQGDILLTTNYSLPTQYKIVANIPYYLTSPLIRKFLESENPPKCMVLMVQKEVAQRICATPPNMSILSASVQFYANAEIISYVTKDKFWPSPKVDSAIIKITPFERPGKISPEKFFRVVKAGFSHPRKQLVNNLSVALKKEREEVVVWLSKNNIGQKQRAETLSIQDWINLTKSE